MEDKSIEEKGIEEVESFKDVEVAFHESKAKESKVWNSTDDEEEQKAS
jgi:hypothetical protein